MKAQLTLIRKADEDDEDPDGPFLTLDITAEIEPERILLQLLSDYRCKVTYLEEVDDDKWTIAFSNFPAKPAEVT